MERLKSIYKGIKTRCYNKNSAKYKNYGSRGVVMCETWKNDFKSFEIWALNNGYTDKLTIDRIDVNGIYEPNNCRWVTLHEQARNRTDNVYVFYKGKKYILGDLAKEYNISRKTLGRRIQNKWDIETALKTPPKPRKRKIVCVEKQLVYESATEAAFIYKIPASNIARAIKRNIKAAGYHWSYY